MKNLVVVAHPNLLHSRVNKRWVDELKKYPEQITVHDLYGRYPDKNIDISFEQSLLIEHGRLILQFPLQWYSTPSLLKQWIDEVFTTSWLFGEGGKYIQGKEFVLAITIGGVENTYQAGGLIGYTISELTRPLQTFATQVGMTMLPSFTFHGAVKATDKDIEESVQPFIEHIGNPELNPIIARMKLLEKVKQK